MNKSMNKSKALFVAVICIASLMIAGLLIYFCFVRPYQDYKSERAEMIEYMSKTPKNDFVAYDNGTDNVYFNKFTLEPHENVLSVLYVTAKEVFYWGYSESQEIIYKTDHSGKNKKDVFIFDGDLISVNMPDENKIFYKVDNKDEYYVRYIRENKTEKITKEEFDASYYENDYYSVKVKEENHRIACFEIRNKKSGVIRQIDEKDLQEILKIEQAKKLSEYATPIYSDFVLYNEKIYVSCTFSEIILLFEYDFNTEKITLFDWTENIRITETFDIYVFVEN